MSYSLTKKDVELIFDLDEAGYNPEEIIKILNQKRKVK